MNKIQKINKLISLLMALKSNEQAYFEYLQTSNECWMRPQSMPDLNSDFDRWRVTIPPPKLWEPKRGKWLIGIGGNTVNINKEHVNDGATRENEKQADSLAAKLRTIARLSAWVDEHNYNKDFIIGFPNFHIYEDNGNWEYESSYHHFCPETIYMTKAGAIRLSKLLNTGEVKL